MKKHTRLTLLIGIVFCHASLSIASSNDNGPYSPATIIPMAIKFSINIATSICSQAITNYATKIFYGKTAENAISEKLTTIDELRLKSQHDQTLQSIPTQIKSILDNDKKHCTHKAMHIDNASLIDNTSLAEQIALESNSNLYIINSDDLNATTIQLQKAQGQRKDKTELLENRLKKIALESVTKSIPIVYIEIDEKNIFKPIHSQGEIDQLGFYNGTWHNLSENLSSKYRIRIVIIGDYARSKAYDAQRKPSPQEELLSRHEKLSAPRQTNLQTKADNNSKPKVKYNNNIHTIKLDQKNTFFTDEFIKNQIKNHQLQPTGTFASQYSTNQKLTNEWHVTQKMHDQATTNFHKTNKSSLIGQYIYPLFWTQHQTPVITYQTKELSPYEQDHLEKLTPEELKHATKIALAQQVERLALTVERAQNKNGNNNQKKYTIDPSQRSCSVQQEDYTQNSDNTEVKTFSYGYGNLSPTHVITAALNMQNDNIRHERKENLKNSDYLNAHIEEYVQKYEPQATENRRKHLKRSLYQYAHANDFEQEAKAHLPLKIKEEFANKLHTPRDLAGLSRLALQTPEIAMLYNGTRIQDGKIDLEAERKKRAADFKEAIKNKEYFKKILHEDNEGLTDETINTRVNKIQQKQISQLEETQRKKINEIEQRLKNLSTNKG